MKRVLCARLPRPDHPEPLAEKEADHVMRVLRLRDGDTLEALDGQGQSARVTLRIKSGGPRLEFIELTTSAAAGTILPLTLEMAVLKGNAMEWVVEKAVELGVATLVPLLTAHTVVQMKNKGPEAFRERWQKIADQALKQCGRLDRLEVRAPVDLDEWLSHHPSSESTPRLWCDEAARTTLKPTELAPWLASDALRQAQGLRILIGPEGGWSETERHELERSGIKVSLGPWVLRGETAALFATSLSVATLRQKLDNKG